MASLISCEYSKPNGLPLAKQKKASLVLLLLRADLGRNLSAKETTEWKSVGGRPVKD